MLAGLNPAPLEQWYRHNYFSNEIDISGSGVEDYTFGEILKLTGSSFEELNHLKIGDAPTVGSQSIRQKIADRFGDGNANNVIITSGANEAFQFIVKSILQSGDKIITLEPCYHCHDGIAEAEGCEVLKWAVPIASDSEPDFNEFEALVSQGVKAVFLNFPHNPSGKTISPAMLDRIVELARKNDVILIWDAVFQELTYENEKLVDPILSYDKAISLGTFSKVFGAPGLRFGWIISNVDIVEAVKRQKDYGNLYVPYLVEFLAEKIFDHIDNIVQPRLKQAANNRSLVDQWLTDNPFGFSWIKPSGGACGLVKLPAGVDDYQFCVDLLDTQGLLFVPGTCFGCPGYVRLGFGGSTENLQEGLQRLQKYLEER